MDARYRALYKRPEWKALRKRLIKPAPRCRRCPRYFRKRWWMLQLHHTYYVWGRDPWDYPDDCFLVVCRACHKKIHCTEKIPILG